MARMTSTSLVIVLITVVLPSLVLCASKCDSRTVEEQIAFDKTFFAELVNQTNIGTFIPINSNDPCSSSFIECRKEGPRNGTIEQILFKSFVKYPFIGSLPESISDLCFLVILQVQNSGFFGEIPSDFWLLPELKEVKLGLSNGIRPKERFNTTFPPTITNSLTEVFFRYVRIEQENLEALAHSNVSSLKLFDCDIGGSIPDSFLSENSSFKSITLSSVPIQKPLPPIESKNLRNLSLTHCGIPGRIPDVVAPNLTVLYLGYNSLEGGIPPALLSHPTLFQILLNQNKLIGPFPLFTSTALTTLSLERNSFFGELGALPLQIEEIALSCNSLTGTISDLSQYRNLTTFAIAQNFFYGPLPLLPDSITHFSASENNFTGLLPSSFPAGLSQFKVAYNRLYGNLSCFEGHNITTLNVSHNMFTGHFPNVTVTDRIFSFDVSYNNLSGPLDSIPLPTSVFNASHNNFGPLLPSFGGNLVILDLSHNNFVCTNEFQHFEEDNYSLKTLNLSHNSLISVYWFGNPIQSRLFDHLSVIDISSNFVKQHFEPDRVTTGEERPHSYINVSGDSYSGNAHYLFLAEIFDFSGSEMELHYDIAFKKRKEWLGGDLILSSALYFEADLIWKKSHLTAKKGAELHLDSDVDVQDVSIGSDVPLSVFSQYFHILPDGSFITNATDTMSFSISRQFTINGDWINEGYLDLFASLILNEGSIINNGRIILEGGNIYSNPIVNHGEIIISSGDISAIIGDGTIIIKEGGEVDVHLLEADELIIRGSLVISGWLDNCTLKKVIIEEGASLTFAIPPRTYPIIETLDLRGGSIHLSTITVNVGSVLLKSDHFDIFDGGLITNSLESYHNILYFGGDRDGFFRFKMTDDSFAPTAIYLSGGVKIQHDFPHTGHVSLIGEGTVKYVHNSTFPNISALDDTSLMIRATNKSTAGSIILNSSQALQLEGNVQVKRLVWIQGTINMTRSSPEHTQHKRGVSISPPSPSVDYLVVHSNNLTKYIIGGNIDIKKNIEVGEDGLLIHGKIGGSLTMFSPIRINGSTWRFEGSNFTLKSGRSEILENSRLLLHQDATFTIGEDASIILSNNTEISALNLENYGEIGFAHYNKPQYTEPIFATIKATITQNSCLNVTIYSVEKQQNDKLFVFGDIKEKSLMLNVDIRDEILDKSLLIIEKSNESSNFIYRDFQHIMPLKNSSEHLTSSTNGTGVILSLGCAVGSDCELCIAHSGCRWCELGGCMHYTRITEENCGHGHYTCDIHSHEKGIWGYIVGGLAGLGVLVLIAIFLLRKRLKQMWALKVVAIFEN